MKLFLDANIIMDFLGHRDHYMAAANILQLGIENSVELYMTDLTVANVIYSLRKDIGKEKARESMHKLSKFIKISPLTQKESDLAFNSDSPDLEDAFQYFSAISVGCDYLITRDPKHYKYSTKPVMSGEEFLEDYFA